MEEQIYVFREYVGASFLDRYFMLLGISLVLLRIVAGLIWTYHGSQKIFGLFGGGGFKKTIESFKGWLGVPSFLTVLLMIAEFFGGIGVIFGFLTRLSAFGLACGMLVATIVDISAFKASKEKGESIDPTQKIGFPALLFLIALMLMLLGPGRFSIDHLLYEHVFKHNWYFGP